MTTTTEQRCGHPLTSVGKSKRGTYCTDCLPDGTDTTYVVKNVQAFALQHGMHIVASMPPKLGRIACTPFPSEDSATNFAETILTGPAWVVDPQGELVSKHRVPEGE